MTKTRIQTASIAALSTVTPTVNFRICSKAILIIMREGGSNFVTEETKKRHKEDSNGDDQDSEEICYM